MELDIIINLMIRKARNFNLNKLEKISEGSSLSPENMPDKLQDKQRINLTSCAGLKPFKIQQTASPQKQIMQKNKKLEVLQEELLDQKSKIDKIKTAFQARQLVEEKSIPDLLFKILGSLLSLKDKQIFLKKQILKIVLKLSQRQKISLKDISKCILNFVLRFIRQIFGLLQFAINHNIQEKKMMMMLSKSKFG